MSTKNLICIVVDRLHAGMVGAYGNSWIQTEALDRLASESFLFDQAYVQRPELAAIYAGYWLGQSEPPHSPTSFSSTLPAILSASGLHTALISDEPEIAELPGTADFAERQFLEQEPTENPADDVADTGLAQLFGAAIDWLSAPRDPFCLWIHVRGMAGPWDAPVELRNRFAEEDDPTPPAFASVPNYWLPDDADADEVLGIRHAYAGQISLLDICLAPFCEHFRQSGLAENTALAFLSARGFSLGEHQRIGVCDAALYNELVQLVWMMRLPQEVGKLARSQALAQPADLPGTLLDWLGADRAQLASGRASSLFDVISGESNAIRDRILQISQHDRAIRTPAWSLRQPITGAVELYAKPSDRWEVNEVANLLPEIAGGLVASLAEDSAAPADQPLTPLPELLVTEVE